MSGLIPLMLQASASGSRTSVVFPSPPSGRTHSRNLSASSISPPIPVRPSILRHSTHPTPAAMLNLPFTPAEWRRTMAEIKKQHQSRRYRACFARCTEILDNLKDVTIVEPAHLIYLHFYSAHSKEMCARALFDNSPYRAQLLAQARTHYDRAAALIEKAEDSVTIRTRSSSRASSVSSCHSPSSSVSSQTWSVDTGISSPARSVCSFEDLSKSQPQTPVSPVRRIKKKVSFSLPAEFKEEPAVEESPEPFIRPDSPTLGFANDFYMPPFSRKELPPLPANIEEDTPEEEEEEEEEVTPRASILTSDPFEDALDQFHQFRESFALLGSVNRYCDHLSTLKYQLASHSSNLNTLMEEPQAEEEHFVSSRSRAATPICDETRNFDKQARIERLRKNGWQRKRFDPRRYENLCNSVIAEM